MSVDPTRVRKRSVTIAGHRTSVSLEDAFWQALGEIASAEGRSINQVVTMLDARRPPTLKGGNLSSTLRVYVLRKLQRAAISEN